MTISKLKKKFTLIWSNKNILDSVNYDTIEVAALYSLLFAVGFGLIFIKRDAETLQWLNDKDAQNRNIHFFFKKGFLFRFFVWGWGGCNLQFHPHMMIICTKSGGGVVLVGFSKWPYKYYPLGFLFRKHQR